MVNIFDHHTIRKKKDDRKFSKSPFNLLIII